MEFDRRLIVVTFVVLICGMHSTLGEETRRSINQIIRQAASHKSAAPAPAFNFFWNPKKHLALREYDIVLPQEEFLSLYSPHRDKRAIGIKRNKMWPENIVYYEIDKSFRSGEKTKIRNAFKKWQQATCLTFKESNTAENRIRFIDDDDGCWSSVGMDGGVQDLGLGYGCVYVEVILHEIGHALGLEHEQTHPERDDYITILYQNVEKGYEDQFDKQSYDYIEKRYPRIPYDYQSIMHYAEDAFSDNDKITIKTKDPYYQTRIGYYTELSKYDVQTVREMYGCVDTDGTGGGDDDNGDDKVDDCINDAGDELCQYFLGESSCEAEASFMEENCKKACQMC